MGSVRRELHDHVVVLGEHHLRRLLRVYVAYYHDDRTHLGLVKATSSNPPVQNRTTPSRRTSSNPGLGIP